MSLQDPLPAPALSEQRRASRRVVVYRLDVTDKSNRLIGYLKDISLGGLKLRTKTEAAMTTCTLVRIVFPLWMELGTYVEFRGRIAWCKPVENGGMEGGFVFEEIKEKDRQKLDSLIEKIAEAAIEDGHL